MDCPPCIPKHLPLTCRRSDAEEETPSESRAAMGMINQPLLAQHTMKMMDLLYLLP